MKKAVLVIARMLKFAKSDLSGRHNWQIA